VTRIYNHKWKYQNRGSEKKITSILKTKRYEKKPTNVLSKKKRSKSWEKIKKESSELCHGLTAVVESRQRIKKLVFWRVSLLAEVGCVCHSCSTTRLSRQWNWPLGKTLCFSASVSKYHIYTDCVPVELYKNINKMSLIVLLPPFSTSNSKMMSFKPFKLNVMIPNQKIQIQYQRIGKHLKNLQGDWLNSHGLFLHNDETNIILMMIPDSWNKEIKSTLLDQGESFKKIY